MYVFVCLSMCVKASMYVYLFVCVSCESLFSEFRFSKISSTNLCLESSASVIA